MKALFLMFVVLLSQNQSESRTLPEWYRVYTFDESVIELNTDYVMFSDRKTGRVRFRWSFLKPETMGQERLIKYQSRLEEIEWDCAKKRYRLHDVRMYDAEGRLMRSEEGDPPGQWREVKFGSMMQKLMTPACQLIELRRRVPALER